MVATTDLKISILKQNKSFIEENLQINKFKIKRIVSGKFLRLKFTPNYAIENLTQNYALQ
jgi:hypothetical protein